MCLRVAQDTTFENDRAGAVRFLGWLSRAHAEAPLRLSVFGAPELGEWVEEYCAFLQDDRGCKNSTLANYLTAIINTASYVAAVCDDACSDAIDELANLRNQCDAQVTPQLARAVSRPCNRKALASSAQARIDRLYARRHKAWISWEDVQRTRVAALQHFEGLPKTTPPAQRARHLNDLICVLLHSVTPPDRCGATGPRLQQRMCTLTGFCGRQGWCCEEAQV